jgi:hypothetical protein
MINLKYINIRNMFRRSGYFIIFIILITSLINCRPRDRYDKLVKEELAKGIRVDSLFFDLHLGMTDKEFYTKCWELNKQGLIRQGSSNTSVFCKMEDLEDPVEMNFYPSFYEGKIYEMPVQYNYEGWAPWNKHLSSDSLQLEILRLYKEWYGDDFMKVKHPKRGIAFINVNGNRRISIFKSDERHVWAIFTDLLVEKKIKDLKNSENSPEKRKNEVNKSDEDVVSESD